MISFHHIAVDYGPSFSSSLVLINFFLNWWIFQCYGDLLIVIQCVPTLDLFQETFIIDGRLTNIEHLKNQVFLKASKHLLSNVYL